MSTADTYTRKFGRIQYKIAARGVRQTRRQWSAEVADAQAKAFVLLFTEDATRAGEPEHFNADTFNARTQLLPKSEEAPATPGVADLEAMLASSPDGPGANGAWVIDNSAPGDGQE